MLYIQCVYHKNKTFLLWKYSPQEKSWQLFNKIIISTVFTFRNRSLSKWEKVVQNFPSDLCTFDISVVRLSI